ncbi:hypothetical protein LLE49_23850 [Alicyclobacillus tolerans]|uniref:hypothetical protein n=1 Tax=Alicyclobacillus tolerans TaxID=90970 RepID=UPI001F1B070D|nr:hypothetical protein [Alicyclobacillus tolerans]MCF8567759.1 hypothetical protein [Alicyclobacillus tolerans]
MYEAEISDALTKRNLNQVWILMNKRTQWVQNVKGMLSEAEVKEAHARTEHIIKCLTQIQEELKKEIVTVAKRRHALFAYEWSKGVSSP